MKNQLIFFLIIFCGCFVFAMQLDDDQKAVAIKTNQNCEIALHDKLPNEIIVYILFFIVDLAKQSDNPIQDLINLFKGNDIINSRSVCHFWNQEISRQHKRCLHQLYLANKLAFRDCLFRLIKLEYCSTPAQNLKLLRCLLQANIELNGMVLMWAAKVNDKEVIDLLFSHIINLEPNKQLAIINDSDNCGLTVLLKACFWQNRKFVELLLNFISKLPADIQQRILYFKNKCNQTVFDILSHPITINDKLILKMLQAAGKK